MRLRLKMAADHSSVWSWVGWHGNMFRQSWLKLVMRSLFARTGAFGGRMKENVERCGGTAIMVMDDWGKPVDVAKVEEALKANPGCQSGCFRTRRNLHRCSV